MLCLVDICEYIYRERGERGGRERGGRERGGVRERGRHNLREGERGGGERGGRERGCERGGRGGITILLLRLI